MDPPLLPPPRDPPLLLPRDPPLLLLLPPDLTEVLPRDRLEVLLFLLPEFLLGDTLGCLVRLPDFTEGERLDLLWLWLSGRVFQTLVPFLRGSTGLIVRLPDELLPDLTRAEAGLSVRLELTEGLADRLELPEGLADRLELPVGVLARRVELLPVGPVLARRTGVIVAREVLPPAVCRTAARLGSPPALARVVSLICNPLLLRNWEPVSIWGRVRVVRSVPWKRLSADRVSPARELVVRVAPRLSARVVRVFMAFRSRSLGPFLSMSPDTRPYSWLLTREPLAA